VTPSGGPLPAVAGLRSVVAGDGVVRVAFERPANGDSFALFVGTNAATLFAGAPVAVDPVGEAWTETGLVNGQRVRIGLATRSSALDPWRPSGAIVSARPGAPIFVDPSASPVGADGTTPATAFPDLALALIVAGGSSGNVWLRGGDFGALTLDIASGVAVHGGFAAGFDPDDRDPTANPSIVRGASGVPMVNVLPGGTDATLDGLVLDGDGLATIGVDSEDTPLELRSLVVRACSDRGIRVRGPLSGDPIEIVLTDVSSIGNGADGMSAVGAFDAVFSACQFSGNVQEGLEFDDLVADSGRAVGVTIDGCLFSGNGSEGVDIDLAAALAAVPPGGSFDVLVRESVFELNALSGLLVDLDYETVPQWSADIAIVGCSMRANRGAGALLDLDSTQRTFVHRSRFESNAQQGLYVTSESANGVAVVSSSLFAGNGGAGLDSALGNVVVLASHGVFTGNTLFGQRAAAVRATAASSLVWLQSSSTSNVASFGAATAASGELVRVPTAVVRATAAATGGVVVDQVSSVEIGDVVELGADGVARSVTGINGSSLVLDPVPDAFTPPLALAVFTAPGDVDEDHTPTPGAVHIGLGLGGADPGPRGSPEGAEPGPGLPAGDPWLRPATVTPAPIGSLASQALVRVEFDRALAPSSANSSSVRVTNSVGAPLSASIAVVSGALELTAPVGGWPASVRVELDRGLEATDGSELASPLVLAFGP
jgi:hypothetical protein